MDLAVVVGDADRVGALLRDAVREVHLELRGFFRLLALCDIPRRAEESARNAIGIEEHPPGCRHPVLAAASD